LIETSSDVAVTLPKRRGDRPIASSMMPHKQLTQNSPVAMYKRLAERIFSLPDVEEKPSIISVPGARALWLKDGVGTGADGAFLLGREFAHLHPPEDGSLHIALPKRWCEEAIEKGWAEPHPAAQLGFAPQNIVMVYGPRDEEELEVVYNLVVVSYKFAKGLLV